MNETDSNSDGFQRARRQMVQMQLAARGIHDERVLEAMGKVPRHLFVPEEMREHAYEDSPLPIGEGQTISQPYIVAKMTEALSLNPHDRILEIGTGSGYQAALLAELAGHVYGIELLASLLDRAHRILGRLGYENITLRQGDGTLGWTEFAPYNAIMVTAGAPHVPEPLERQLAVGGRMVIPVGDRYSQELVTVIKRPEGMAHMNLGGCRFVNLMGEQGWPA
jgi:protein-L-isoaspartate(D-aspartate) O-methyltransferase